MSDMQIPPEEIARVYIAGAFGNHIRNQDIIDIGLLPAVLKERIQFIGNAALSGAEAILVSRSARKRAQYISRSMQYVEVAGRPDFQEKYVAAIQFGVID